MIIRKGDSILATYTLKERIVFVIFLAVVLVGLLGMIITLNNRASIMVPSFGGTHTEGVLGTPRYINPVLARTDTDRDLTRLVFSGLMRREGSHLVPDIAHSFDISEDETMYTFYLRDDVVFHDNTPLTADDVIFTIQSVQNITLESPHFVAWRGVTAEKIDDYTVAFRLPEAYAGFLDNTTLGILPLHLWQSIPFSQFSLSSRNLEPIGSGPFRVQNLQLHRSGAPEKLHLRRHRNYHLGRPYLQNISVIFHGNNQDLKRSFERGRIDALRSIDPLQAVHLLENNSYTLHQAPLPRVFGIFFNQNENEIFNNTEVVRAIETRIHKTALVDRVLASFGTPLDGPFPPGMVGYIPQELDIRNRNERIEEASQILEDANWHHAEGESVRSQDGETLSFTLTTVNVPELVEAAEIVQSQLSDIGIRMSLEVYDIGILEQEIIRPRTYEALFFGQIFTHDTDIFAYWHSSYRADPGLNIGLFADARADTALNNAYRTFERREREEYYETFLERLESERPAVFLYSPHFLYITRSTEGITLQGIRTPADRFNDVHEWHRRTQRIWRFLTPHTDDL